MAEFSYNSVDNLAIISIEGRFTLVDKDVFQNIISSNIDLEENEMALDMRLMTYIDSSGIGDVIKLKMEANKFNNTIYIFGLKDAPEKSFKSAKLDSIFTIMTEEEFKKQFNYP